MSAILKPFLVSNIIRATRSLAKPILTARNGSSFLGADDITKYSPFDELEVQVDRESSQTNPIIVNAYGKERDIACVCGEVHFMRLTKGPPVKSECGHWFQLVDQPQFWNHPRPPPPVEPKDEQN